MRSKGAASQASATIRPLLTVFGEGTNSDYYPLVDQDAPKARFAGETATGVMRVAVRRRTDRGNAG